MPFTSFKQPLTINRLVSCEAEFVNLKSVMLPINNPVWVRPEARQQIQDTLQANKIPEDYGLRVGVRGGGCGSSWLLGFDLPGPTDEVYNVEGVRVIIDRKHLLYVLGAEIGYEPGGYTVEKGNGK